MQEFIHCSLAHFLTSQDECGRPVERPLIQLDGLAAANRLGNEEACLTQCPSTDTPEQNDNGGNRKSDRESRRADSSPVGQLLTMDQDELQRLIVSNQNLIAAEHVSILFGWFDDSQSCEPHQSDQSIVKSKQGGVHLIP